MVDLQDFIEDFFTPMQGLLLTALVDGELHSRRVLMERSGTASVDSFYVLVHALRRRLKKLDPTLDIVYHSEYDTSTFQLVRQVPATVKDLAPLANHPSRKGAAE